MQNMVVASVAIPSISNVRHACRPSQVAGILIHTRFVSKSGAKCLKMATIPERIVSKGAGGGDLETYGGHR
jgi:hypothetical protein